MALKAIFTAYTIDEAINRNMPTRIFSIWELNQLKRIQVNYNTRMMNDRSTRLKLI